jgi:hypothetical protein
MNKSKLAGVAMIASLLAAPALAQNTATGNGSGAAPSPVPPSQTSEASSNGGYTGTAILIQKDQNKSSNNNVSANGKTKSAQEPNRMNPVLAANGDARASKVIGTAVYNEQDKKLGTINDILVGRNGVFAVINASNHKVEVPFERLQFGNAKVDDDEKVVMPQMTQAQLKNLPKINYTANTNGDGDSGNTNGGGVVAGNNASGSMGAFAGHHGGNVIDNNADGNAGVNGPAGSSNGNTKG